MPVDAARAKSLFLAASDLSDPAERAAYLGRECGGDAELRDRVEALLRANDASPLPPSGAGDATNTQAPNGRPETEDFGDPTARVGLVLAGKYKLIEAIGEGGMGSVYMARQTEPVKRAVAVKVIKAGMDSKAVLARFEAERQALAMMDHPNIARVLDAGTTDGGRSFFVMELVKGVPITQYCDERRLTPRQRLELFVPVCQAIQHAHQKGVIHRDIKPSNVLVALYDDRPVPKVIDFGVAKAAGQALTDKTLMTGFGAVVGTPEYMSPEQANLNNLDIDTRSDVYSLGVLLYELLTGTTPVDRKSLGKAALLEILRIVREVEAPRPSAKLSTIDTLPSVAANRGTEPAKLSKLMKGELDWVLLKALEKDRTRRYESANALSRDIQRYLADEVVEARPPSTGYRLKKFVRRHKGQVIAASLVLLALLGGIAGTTWGMIRAEIRRVEREDEKTQRGRAEALRQGAEIARDDAQRKEKAERWERYRANVAVAAGALQLQNSGTARSALDAAPPELRNWEWQYFHGQLDGASLVLPVPGGKIHSLVLSPSGRQIAFCRDDQNEVTLYDVAAGTPDAVLRGHSAPVTSVAYRPDGKQMVTASNDQTIRLWDPATGRGLALLRPEAAPADLDRNPLVAYNSDGSRIASHAQRLGRGAVTSRLWDVTTGKEVAVLGKW
jgi:serine/threonine protein kinase